MKKAEIIKNGHLNLEQVSVPAKDLLEQDKIISLNALLEENKKLKKENEELKKQIEELIKENKL